MVTDIKYDKLVEIGGHSYRIHCFSPTKAWKLGVRLSKVFGEPFVAMAQAAGDEGNALEVLPVAIRALVSNIDPDVSMALVKELMACVEIQGDKKSIIIGEVFDLHFQGMPGQILRVLGAVVEFQFKDFISAVGDAIAGVKTAMTGEVGTTA